MLVHINIKSRDVYNSNFLYSFQPPSPQFRKHFFSQRVVSPWNDLPCDIKTAPTLNTFKSRYDKYVKNY